MCLLFTVYGKRIPNEQAFTVTFPVTVFVSLNHKFPVDHCDTALKQSVLYKALKVTCLDQLTVLSKQ